MKKIAVNICNEVFEVEVGTTPNDLIHWDRINGRIWEPFTFDCIEKYVSSDTVFFDVGAHIGMVSLFASKKASKVVAIEADPIASSSLMRNLYFNNIDNVDVYCGAISIERMARLSCADFGNSMSNIMGSGERKISVAAFDFDSIMSDYLYYRYKFIKIDIEGAEETLVKQLSKYSKIDGFTILLSLHAHVSHVSSQYAEHMKYLLEQFNYVEASNGLRSIDEILQTMDECSVLCSNEIKK